MKFVTSLAAGALIGAFAAPGLASDLKIDGQVSASAALGSSVQIDLVGNPGLVAVVSLDVSAGPVVILGEVLPIGITPALTSIAIGTTDGAGLLSFSAPIPNSPILSGLTFFLLGAVIDPSDPNGIDFSNGADLTLLDDPIEVDLAGVVRPGYPHFDWITTVREGDDLNIAVDPTTMGGLLGVTADVYVVADRTQAEWDANSTLVDVSGSGPTSVTFGPGGVLANTFLVDSGTLSGDAGAGLGVGYDIVVDMDGDGQLSAADQVDGYSTLAGIYIASDTSAPGPFTVIEALYSGGGPFQGQNLYYPSNIASLNDVPIVIIAHGNGHNYQWYDHIGMHLASYGYVVMSHQNNTVPGIETSSTTTLTNTDAFLGNLDIIVGGLLDGNVDTSNVTWLGHSRGGEGVARAYDRILDGTFVPNNFTADDIVLISSIAPTDFLGTNSSTPHDVNYHLWVGAGDNDVSGCANNEIVQSYHLLARAENQRQGTTLYGMGHGWFHDGTGGAVVTGPCQIGKTIAHSIIRGYVLPLVEFHNKANPAAEDFLWRHYEDLAPQGVLVSNPCVVVNLQYRESTESGKFVIDDFQSQPADLVASSGAVITTDLIEFVTGQLNDATTSFTNTGTDAFNGMTYCRSTDFENGAVLRYTDDRSLTYTMNADDRDFTGFGALTFRACQSTRHGITTSEFGDVVFEVRLTDTDGDSSTIRIDALIAGIEEPYQRVGCGTGVGWGNEFEQVRMALRGFTVGQPALDLDSIDRIEFLFGPSHGSTGGRLGLDDIELTVN